MKDGYNNSITAQQRSAWVWTAVLALGLGVLPARVARWGSAAGWTAPLLALPGIRLAERTAGKLGDDRGLAGAFCTLLGGRVGCALTIIYMVWAVALGGAQLRMAVHRLNSAAGWSLDSGLAAGVLVFTSLWLVRGRTEFCGRWAVLALRGLLVVLGGVVLLSLPGLRAEHLLPVWVEDVPPALAAAGTTLGVACVGVYGGFLPLHPTAGGKSRTKAVAVCLLLALALLCIQGSLGVPLAAVLEDPFLSLTRNVGIEGTFRRTESLISAVLLLGDLGLLSLLIEAARQSGKQILKVKWWGWAVAALMWICALMLTQPVHAQSVRVWLLPTGGLVLGFAVPLLLLMLDRAREKRNEKT